jgi:predicted amidohydrolase
LTDTSTRPSRLAVCQFAPRLGDLGGNAQRIAQWTTDVDADLVVFPELALTGYDVRDQVHELALDPAHLPLHLPVAKGRAVILGFIERSAEAVPYNAAAVLQNGGTAFVHRKLYLPTYGMFDEGRYFGRGRRVSTFQHRNLRLGILICEDFWHPSLCYLLACQRIDVLLVPAAAPGRNVWPADDHATFRSTAVWERMARVTAQLFGIYVVLCNRVGVEAGTTFAGGSLVAGPSGDILKAAPDPGESVLEVTVDAAEISRARRPCAHLRDEDPHIVLNELQRILIAS